jgi:hypothetical protein
MTRARLRKLVISRGSDAIVPMVGAILLEQNDEWAVQRARHMTPETIMTYRHKHRAAGHDFALMKSTNSVRQCGVKSTPLQTRS